jgi:hypothetical protein
MAEKIELYSPAYWKKWKEGVKVKNKKKNKKELEEKHVKTKNNILTTGVDSIDSTIDHKNINSASSINRSLDYSSPKVDHGVATVRNIRAYKTAFADSVNLPQGWEPDKPKLTLSNNPFLPTRYGGTRRPRRVVIDVEPRLIGLKEREEPKIPFSKIPGQFGQKQFNSLHRSTSLGTFLQGNRFNDNTNLNVDGVGPGSYKVEAKLDKRGGVFPYDTRAKRINPNKIVPGPIYRPKYNTSSKRIQSSVFSKFGPRWNTNMDPNTKNTLGPKYNIPSTLGNGPHVSFAYHDEYEAQKAAESIRTVDPTLYEFKNFGYGCNLEEHIEYGQCLDGKCSERSRWEQTNKLKTRMEVGYKETSKTGNKRYNSKHRTDGHDTPLHLSCRAGDVKAFKSILKGTNDWDHKAHAIVWRGPDVNKANKDGQTPLHLVCLYNNLIFCCILLQYERQKVDLDLQDNDGDTPLHIVARTGNDHLLKKLINAGANPDLQNKNGNMPKDLCSNQRCYQLLREASDIIDVNAQLKKLRLHAKELQLKQQRRGY